MYLLDHYFEHATDSHRYNPSYAYARQVGVPTMAAENHELLCTLLAIGAGRLALDLLQSYDPFAHMDQIANLISKGDHYHATALSSLHSKLADGLHDLEIAHAHSAIVFGYSAARRRITRMLHRQQQRLDDAPKPETDLPSNLEWMHLLRGVRTIGERSAIPRDLQGVHQVILKLRQTIDSVPEPSPDEIKTFSERYTATRHGLTLWVSSTIKPAIQSLHTDLDDFYRRFRADHDSSNDPGSAFASTYPDIEFETLQSLAACRSALSALEGLSCAVFQSVTGSAPSSTSASPVSTASLPALEMCSQHGEPRIKWRETYLAPPSFSASEPLMRGILTWPNHISAPFVALLTEPLPPPARTVFCSTELRRPTRDKVSPELEISHLAWNIYAHWAALTVLIEEECW